jgi:uncharacterized repeat protein (TIGR02543 family)
MPAELNSVLGRRGEFLKGQTIADAVFFNPQAGHNFMLDSLGNGLYNIRNNSAQYTVGAASHVMELSIGGNKIGALIITCEIPVHTLTFDSNGGSPVADIQANHNTRIFAAPVTAKEGYRFLRWETDDNTTFLFGNISGTRVVRSITFTAIWQVNTYTVTFNSDGGTPVASATVNYNNTVEQPLNPTREGYTFAGWTLNSAAFDFSTAITGNITLTANWSKNAVNFIRIDQPTGTSVELSESMQFTATVNADALGDDII